MNESFIEFEILETSRFELLCHVFEALSRAKKSGDFHDDDYWLGFFDNAAKSYFWWPTNDEISDWKLRWDATPVDERITEPGLQIPWLFGSMIDAIRETEFELARCVSISDTIGRLEFLPHTGPYGGPDSLRALIESFGFQVTNEGGT